MCFIICLLFYLCIILVKYVLGDSFQKPRENNFNMILHLLSLPTKCKLCMTQNWKRIGRKKIGQKSGYESYSIDLIMMLNVCCLSPISRMVKLLERRILLLQSTDICQQPLARSRQSSYCLVYEWTYSKCFVYAFPYQRGNEKRGTFRDRNGCRLGQ